MNFLDILAVILSAAVSAMGLGGGGVLILYLTLVRDVPQLEAQGINLLFFTPAPLRQYLSTENERYYSRKSFCR